MPEGFDNKDVQDAIDRLMALYESAAMVHEVVSQPDYAPDTPLWRAIRERARQMKEAELAAIWSQSYSADPQPVLPEPEFPVVDMSPDLAPTHMRMPTWEQQQMVEELDQVRTQHRIARKEMAREFMSRPLDAADRIDPRRIDRSGMKRDFSVAAIVTRDALQESLRYDNPQPHLTPDAPVEPIMHRVVLTMKFGKAPLTDAEVAEARARLVKLLEELSAEWWRGR